MKTTLFAILVIISVSLNGQSSQLSTFEEMWIVGVEFHDFSVDIKGFDEPILFTPKAVKNIKSFEDLNKIVVGSKFISLRLVKTENKFEKESKESRGTMLNLSEKHTSGEDIKGSGSCLVVFEQRGELVIGIPTKHPEKLMDYFKANKLTISDKNGIFNNMSIKEIRIENGTYGKI